MKYKAEESDSQSEEDASLANLSLSSNRLRSINFQYVGPSCQPLAGLSITTLVRCAAAVGEMTACAKSMMTADLVIGFRAYLETFKKYKILLLKKWTDVSLTARKESLATIRVNCSIHTSFLMLQMPHLLRVW